MSDTADDINILKDLAATDQPSGSGVIPNIPVGDNDTDAAAAEHETDSPEKIDHYKEALATSGTPWLPIIKRLSINLFIPFINGIMLGFGEIMAHEVGLIFGWRTANVVDPTLRPPATNPRQRRKWLFGIM